MSTNSHWDLVRHLVGSQKQRKLSLKVSSVQHSDITTTLQPRSKHPGLDNTQWHRLMNCSHQWSELLLIRYLVSSLIPPLYFPRRHLSSPLLQKCWTFSWISDNCLAVWLFVLPMLLPLEENGPGTTRPRAEKHDKGKIIKDTEKNLFGGLTYRRSLKMQNYRDLDSCPPNPTIRVPITL